jgi:hypothetical protein
VKSEKLDVFSMAFHFARAGIILKYKDLLKIKNIIINYENDSILSPLWKLTKLTKNPK